MDSQNAPSAEAAFAHRDLIYDWNDMGETLPPPLRPVQFDDETLRDGLQAPSVRTPSIDEKIRLLHLMNDLGIHTANLGLPGAGAAASRCTTFTSTAGSTSTSGSSR